LPRNTHTEEPGFEGTCLKELGHGVLSLFWPRTKSPLNGRKPENNSLLRQKNIKEIIINHNGTRMVKDGKD